MKLSFCPFSAFLFASSAAAYTGYLARKAKKTNEKKFDVVFILGGPGAGKGTQCELLSKNLGWAHLSAGDLLRAERKSGSELADIINAKISNGELVPSSITVTLIKNAMEKLYKEKKQTKFLIDGFPRGVENCSVWEEQMANISSIKCVLFMECPEDVLTARLLERGKTSGRNDDNIDTILKRFRTFKTESMPIVEMYEKKGLSKTIVADRSVEDVYNEVSGIISNL
jgi:UMP-CMP kinase